MHPLIRISVAIMALIIIHTVVDMSRDKQVQVAINKIAPSLIKLVHDKNAKANTALAFIALDKAYTDTHTIIGATPAIRNAIYLKESQTIWAKMLASHATISDKLRFDSVVRNHTNIMLGA